MDKRKVNHFIFGLVIFLGRGLGTACFVSLCMGALVFWVEVWGPIFLWVCAWGHLFSGERPGGRCFLGGMGAIVFWVARGLLFSGWCGVYCFLGGKGRRCRRPMLSSILG